MRLGQLTFLQPNFVAAGAHLRLIALFAIDLPFQPPASSQGNDMIGIDPSDVLVEAGIDFP
ncbi:MAG: hypothetical protein JO298_02530 [Verrucomicrobia bacterium]|nr:hypothetical protein [Verrucomicrobiota bacterium]